MATLAYNSAHKSPKVFLDSLPPHIARWLRDKDRSRDPRLTGYVPGYFDKAKDGQNAR